MSRIEVYGAAVAGTYSDPVTLNGLQGYNFDPAHTTATATPLAAVIYLMKIPVPKTITIGNILLVVGTAGTSYTNTQVGVYNSSGTLLGQSAVLASAGTNTFGTTGTKTIALTAVGSLTVEGSSSTWVWAALHMGTNAATAANFRGDGPTSVLSINAGLTVSTGRFVTQTGHATNDLATIGDLTPASGAFVNLSVPWIALAA